MLSNLNKCNPWAAATPDEDDVPEIKACKPEDKPVPKTCNILVGCTGALDAMKLPELLPLLKGIKLEHRTTNIKVICSSSVRNFVDLSDIRDIAPVFTDADEWMTWQEMGDPIVHIDLRKWADVFVIAPLGANTLAKIANGICDTLLTCVARAWDMNKPFLFCPSMHSSMTKRSLTSLHTSLLVDWGFKEIPCMTELSELDEIILLGMAPIPTIVDAVTRALIHYHSHPLK